MTNQSKTVVNQCEMRIVGLKRSGNHAIINWIGGQYPGQKVYFLNNCKPLENPYNTKHAEDSPESIIFRDYTIDRVADRFNAKDCLIYSYENRSLQDIHNDTVEELHDGWVGKSQRRFDILILRDPFNWIASHLQREMKQDRSLNSFQKRYESLKSLWLQYAREFIGESNILKNNKTLISYNSWAENKGYRQELANKLGLDFSDIGIDQVVAVGGGSSFDGQEFDGEARKMDISQRWQRFKSNDFYRALLSDQELIRSSNTIFRQIPGTETLYSHE